MKLRNFILGAVAAVMAFAACEKKQDLGAPALTLSATELTFEKDGGDQTLTLNSTRDWQVTSTAEWVMVNPASGKASAEDQAVAVSALANDGGNRSATLTFTNGMVEKVVKVSQEGDGASTGEGNGTEASPYSASQALEITKEMAKDVEGAEKVYVSGIVTKIKDAYSSQYGNVSFYVTDDGVEFKNHLSGAKMFFSPEKAIEIQSGIVSVEERYLLSNLTAGITISGYIWGSTMLTPTEQEKYLWNYEIITYSDGSTTTTAPHIASMFSKDNRGF